LPHIVYQGEDRQQTNNAVVQYHIYQGDKAAAKPRIDFERQAQTEQSKAKQSKAKQRKRNCPSSILFGLKMLSSTSTSTSPSVARRSAPNADFDDYVDPLGAGVVDDGNDNDNDSGMMQDVTIDDGYNNNNNNNVNRSNSGVGQYMEDGYDQQVINVNSNTSKIWMILLVAIFISFFALIIGNNNHGSSSSGGVNSGTTNKSKSKTITPSVKWSIVIIIISLLICFGVNICYYFPNSSSCSKVFITTKSGRLIELILVS
jgi:hypothetical protein